MTTDTGTRADASARLKCSILKLGTQAAEIVIKKKPLRPGLKSVINKTQLVSLGAFFSNSPPKHAACGQIHTEPFSNRFGHYFFDENQAPDPLPLRLSCEPYRYNRVCPGNANAARLMARVRHGDLKSSPVLDIYFRPPGAAVRRIGLLLRDLEIWRYNWSSLPRFP